MRHLLLLLLQADDFQADGSFYTSGLFFFVGRSYKMSHRGNLARMFGGGVASQRVAQGVVEIAQLKMTHDGVGSDTTPPFVPKQNLILAQTSVPQTAFQGSQYQIEFEIPRHLGKMLDNQLNFQITFPNTSGGALNASIMPTTFWCDAIEVLYNGNVVERVEREEIHQETVQYLTDPELLKQARRLNVDSTTGGTTTFPVPNGGITKSFWLPLWSNCLSSAQPYIRGFDGTWKYRLWLTNNIWATGDGLPNSGLSAPVLKQMYMYITEAGLQPGVESAVMSAHSQGAVYRTVIRNKWVKTESSIAANQEYQQTLTAFNTDSSALVLYVKPQDAFPLQRIQKLQIAGQDDFKNYVQIRDAANGELTIQLQADEVSVDASLYVPLTSVSTLPFTAATTPQDVKGLQKFYLFPFCSNLDKVLCEGKVAGGYLLTGQERIVINPATTLQGALTAANTFGDGGVQVCVVSYEYCKISIQNRQPSVRRTV